jgi:ubiquitin carboxyl-terminal hydrolase 20/33
MFHGYTQQDTMDFVRCIFERIHDEMRVQIVQPSSNNTHKITESPDSSHRRKSERLARQDGGKRQCPSNKSKGFPQYRSIVSDVFGGTLRSEIRCLECDNVSVKDDPFYDVSVQICATPEGPKGTKSSFGYIGNLFSSIGESFGINGKPVKLETCLGAFSAPEILDGKDRYKCEKCNRLVDSKKTLKFKELSQILCIQLKRFRHESYFSSKIGTHVVFPIDSLDMRPFLHEDASEKTKKETRYYLSSIITHRGSFGSGHYIAYCRHLGTNQWLEFDDSSVTVVSEEEISKVQVYAMFYSLVDWNSRKEREEWAPKITEAVPEKDKGVYISQLWYNRWCTMSDPGPMDNSEIICPHGSLLPEKLVNAVELVQYVSNDVYEYFVKRHGESSGVPPLQDAVECERCMEEDRQLDIRRKREEKDISALDTSTLKAGEHWYLIASEWLVQWGQFKSGDGLPPGPISNESLMGENGPLPDLIRGLHYRGVNRRVWDYFHRAYGGGPIIMRRSINIYGPSPEPVGRDNESGDDVYVDVVGQ